MPTGLINPSQDPRVRAAVAMVLKERPENWTEGHPSGFQCLLQDLGLVKSVVRQIFGVEATHEIDWEVFLQVQETRLATAFLFLKDGNVGGEAEKTDAAREHKLAEREREDAVQWVASIEDDYHAELEAAQEEDLANAQALDWLDRNRPVARAHDKPPLLSRLDHPDATVNDSGLWDATLQDPPHDIEGTEIEAFNPWRAKLLRDYPLQADYEEFLEDNFEDGVQNELAFHQFILMEDLRLAWLACNAIFNEQATPQLAWKIYLETKREAADYARLLAGKDERWCHVKSRKNPEGNMI